MPRQWRVLVAPMALCLLLVSQAHAQADEIDCVDLESCFQTFMSIDGLGPSIIAAVVAALIALWLKEHFKRRDHYLTPYTKWCIIFSGMLREFGQLCKSIRDDKYNEEMSQTYVIFHIWAMHKEVEEAYKWLPMFLKYHKTEGVQLDLLLDEVDKLWHKLENDNQHLLGKQRNADEFRLIVKNLNEDDRKKFFDTTRDELKPSVDSKLSEESIESIQDCLTSRIPRKYIPIPTFMLHRWADSKAKREKRKEKQQPSAPNS